MLPFALSLSLLPSLLLLPSSARADPPLFDTTRLAVPAVPDGGIPSAVHWSIPATSDEVRNQGLGMSIKQSGGLLGFSIELSVANQILGNSSTELNLPFINYLKNIQQRGGSVRARIGGNSQEGSILYPDGLADGKLLEKTVRTTSVTPLVDYSIQMLWAMSNISESVGGVEWYMGLSFADPTNFTNAEVVMKSSQDALGSTLGGYQFGNEPDLYGASAGRRPSGYTLENYLSELSTALSTISTDTSSYVSSANLHSFLAPSVCWTPQQFVDAGFLTQFGSQLRAFTLQHYPNNNCFTQRTTDEMNALFLTYLTHTAATNLVEQYIGPAQTATDMGLDVYMFETSTASCSGFPGLSTSFGAAMWGVDWAMTLAYRNFSSVNLHVGGRDAWYNPFTSPPPDNNGTKPLWTTGSMYYSMLVVAEALGGSNNSQVVDLGGGAVGNTTNQYTPTYAIYENGVPTRVLALNFVSDATGASTYDLVLDNLATNVSTVQVRYLQAPDISEQYNITWAGQTLGTSWASDGTLKGQQTTVPVTCANGSCSIKVPAPSIALVFLSDEALANSGTNNVVESSSTSSSSGVASAMKTGASSSSRYVASSPSASSAVGSSSNPSAALPLIATPSAGSFLVALLFLLLASSLL